jgi:hypothetical protein
LGASQGECGRHDNEFPLGGHFKEQIRMFGAELGELLIAHWRHSERGWEVGFIDQERHELIVAGSEF